MRKRSRYAVKNRKKPSFALRGRWGRYLLCVVLLGIIIGVNYYLSLPEEVPLKEEYKGVIRLYDKATRTVLGNDFSVISTICEDFSKNLDFSFVKLNKINDITPEESYLLSMEHADVIRYDPDLTDMGRVMSDMEYTSRMKRDITDIPVKSDTGRVVVDYWYDINVILLNSDMLSDLEIEFREQMSKQALRDLIDNITQKGEGLIDCTDERCKQPLFNSKYPSYISEEYDKFREESLGISGFASGETVLYFGSLKDVNYLQRQEARGNEVCEYELFLYPADEPVMYVREIGSYAFLECDDEVKKALLLELADYFHSYEAMQYTENLGMLPWILHEEMKYEKYPYLRNLAYFEGRRILVE